MLKPMPDKIIKFHNSITNFYDFFGFCLAEIQAPKNILNPLLPYKKDGKTIYPTGTWIGIYFSQELKAVMKHGYKVQPIKGYEFSKIDLFTEYVQHFYSLKRDAVGPERWIAKMHLNQLYGIFGRKKELIHTINVNKQDIGKYISTKFIKTIIFITNTVSALLIINNLKPSIVKELNSHFESNFISSYSEVKSNVAIAACVTSYGRIHMIDIINYCNENNIKIYYMDTDSIFTDKPLDKALLGTSLGLMKDELKGSTIDEAYFLGIKRYGYWYIDINGNKIEQSVFSGITRNSLSFNEIVKLFNGQTLTKLIENRFYKSFKDLTIQIKNVNISVKMNPDKKLINNNYLPINIFNLTHDLDTRTYFNKLKNINNSFNGYS